MHGYHAIYAADYYAGIDDAVKHGFDFVQFDLGVPQFFLNDISDTELINIRNYAELNNVRITFHAPGDNVSLFCDYPLIRKGILDEFSLILDKANKLNARHITFHTGHYPVYKKHDDIEYNFNLNYYANILYENLTYMTDRCGDVLICIENSELDELKMRVLEKANTNLTLDTAKFTDDTFDFYVEHRDRIRELHIHDKIKGFRSHQIAGSGIVDFNLFTQFINSNVYITHEVRPIEAAEISRENFKKFTVR